MKLRTQILIFFLVFGLTPLVAAVVINLPLVFGSLELFYHKAHLQNLRADFRDLDQHLASRHEMVRLLAKLPEPGAVLGETDDPDQIDLARARYTQWVNQILLDQLDVIQILFLDADGHERFWLERDADTRQWRPTAHMPDRPPEDFIDTVPRMDPGSVLVSHIRLNPRSGAADPRRLMNLYLISPIFKAGETGQGAMGSVVISVDVGGIAKFYRNTLWVNDDGSYLAQESSRAARAKAFADFPGLEAIFASGKLDLWKGPQGQQVLWVPLFRTESSGPLWVGREVDPSPLAAFRNALTLRVLAIMLALVALVLFMARWVAVRLERFGDELTRGIGAMLKEDEPVTFEWRGPQEVRALGNDLTALARTHAEHARDLRRHARDLEESNRYKSEFLANVSHELRTPLNSILLLSKMLASPDSSLSPDQARQADVIHRAGKDLQALIDNILDHSKIEARETTVNLEWFSPRELTQELVEIVIPQFHQKDLFLEMTCAADAPEAIRSDRDKLSQILKNFLANAVKFTDVGGVRIRIERAGKDFCPLAIRVADTGIGIPADKHELVFEAFKQADGSTSRRYGGTGLGLSISRELARMLGGFIELQSAEGRGATFSLLLPLDPENPESVAPPERMQKSSEPSPAAEPEAPVLANFRGHCVLVVERDVTMLLQLTPMLEKWGLRVSAAADSEEAAETLADEEHCSLVLLDAKMPVGDGCATIQAIRAAGRHMHVPVVVMAATADHGVATQCVEAGADEILPRPFTPAELKGLLERYVAEAADREGTDTAS